MLSEFRMALSFLSRLPVGGSGNIKKIPSYFSLIGYVAASSYFVMKFVFPSYVGTILAVAVGGFLFELFHFDGFLDTLDGILSQKSKEKKLEIMSKGDVGPSAIFYGVLFILAYVWLFSKAKPISFFYMSVFGRLSMNFVMGLSVPAKNVGLGKLFYPYAHKNTLISLMFTLPLTIHPIFYFASLSIAFLTSWLSSYSFKRMVGGYTGDTLGFTNVVAQLFILSVVVFLQTNRFA
jgi:adenosylcobinamide-GDP ribazoletransferase